MSTLAFYFSNIYQQQIEGWLFRKYIQESLFRTLTVRKLCIYTSAVFVLRRYNRLRRLNRLCNFSVRQYEHG